MIDQHGQDAAHEVARRADALRDKSDLDGQAVWLRIRAAVVELLRDSSLPHHGVHQQTDPLAVVIQWQARFKREA